MSNVFCVVTYKYIKKLKVIYNDVIIIYKLYIKLCLIQKILMSNNLEGKVS